MRALPFLIQQSSNSRFYGAQHIFSFVEANAEFFNFLQRDWRARALPFLDNSGPGNPIIAAEMFTRPLGEVPRYC